jgi:hypothetical protein
VQLDTTDVHCVGSKLRFFESVAGSSGLRTRIQLVGLSATMGNVKQLADWLGAELFCTSFRPVPLVEHVVAGNSVIELGDNGKVIRAETAPPSIPGSSAVSDPDRMMSLTARALQRGQQVLIFCSTKVSCSHTCKAISESLHLFWRKTLPASMLSKRRSSEMETGSLEELPFLSHHPSPSPVQVQQLRAARERLVALLQKVDGPGSPASPLSPLAAAVHHWKGIDLSFFSVEGNRLCSAILILYFRIILATALWLKKIAHYLIIFVSMIIFTVFVAKTALFWNKSIN